MFFYAHSGLRYLVLLAGVLALGYALYGAVAGRTYDRTMFRLARAFAGLIHLQLLLGVALLFTQRFYPALIGHIMPMVFADAPVLSPMATKLAPPPIQEPLSAARPFQVWSPMASGTSGEQMR